jgi:hypothetical protein
VIAEEDERLMKVESAIALGQTLSGSRHGVTLVAEGIARSAFNRGSEPRLPV